MCGICGVARSNGPEVDAEAVRAMAHTMTHRGPDDEGVWRSPDGRIGLGQRRLAIIDLSPAGHQPMASANGRFGRYGQAVRQGRVVHHG